MSLCSTSRAKRSGRNAPARAACDEDNNLARAGRLSGGRCRDRAGADHGRGRAAGGRAIATDAAERLWREKRAVFVDVLPAPRRPEGLRPDALWKPLPRRDIPGSLWLPDVGRGALPEPLDAYFRAALARATGGDKSAAVVLYCLADCWMSWNATKRAAAYGYTQLYWYRDGTTGWEAAALPMAEATPEVGRP